MSCCLAEDAGDGWSELGLLCCQLEQMSRLHRLSAFFGQRAPLLLLQVGCFTAVAAVSGSQGWEGVALSALLFWGLGTYGFE